MECLKEKCELWENNKCKEKTLSKNEECFLRYKQDKFFNETEEIKIIITKLKKRFKKKRKKAWYLLDVETNNTEIKRNIELYNMFANMNKES